MDNEVKILVYLETYGNTGEADLIKYGTQKMGLSEAESKELVNRMILNKELERIVHKELQPQVTYVKWGQNISLEQKTQVYSSSINQERQKQEACELAEKILREAEIVAENRIKLKYSSGKQ